MHFGNFISGQTFAHTKSTAILDMQIRKNGQTGKITIDSVDYTPFYCYDRGGSTKNRYELIDMREGIAQYESGNTEKINTNLYNILKSELQRVLARKIKKKNKTAKHSIMQIIYLQMLCSVFINLSKNVVRFLLTYVRKDYIK